MAKKDKKSKVGGDYWNEDDELMDTSPQEFGASANDDEPTSEPVIGSAAESVEDNEDNEASGGDDLMSALRRSKQKKADKEEAAAAEAAAAVEPAVQVKSKKEKEREKKEREKAKKKAQAERKKTAPTIVKKSESKAEVANDEAGDENSPEFAKDEPADVKEAKGAKPKKKNAAIAALQKQLAAKRAAEEAQQQAEEEERKRIEEEQRKDVEDERFKEEARLKKKEKEKQKREELKAQGKLLTKKQKEQQQLLEKRRKQLLESGVQVEGLNGDSEKSKKPVYGKKKPSKKAAETTTTTTIIMPSSVPSEKKEGFTEVKEEVPVEVEKVDEIGKKVEELTLAGANVDDEKDNIGESWENDLEADEVEESWEALADEPTARINGEKLKPSTVEKVVTKGTKPEPKYINQDSSAKDEEATVLHKATLLSAEKKAEISDKREERMKGAVANANAKDLRSPICCILGHVDTGKTKLLDKVRQTNVQEGEAGGITQQIGATYFPIDAIQSKTKVMEKYVTPTYNVPGLLVIDTPGHESFTNLRTRGSSLCNIAILVVDIMHGLEPQTLESIRLLRDKKTPFVVALNKVDRLYGWDATSNNSFRDSLSKQQASTQREFQDRLEQTKVAFAEQGLNAEVYYQNKNLSRTVSLVPTSAITGEGIPDLLYLLLELTQSRMSKQLMYLSHLEATILEVKVVEGLGTTIDVILSNGILREGDRIVLCGQNGPIATNVRALLTPQPLRELRVKSSYVHHKEVKAALGVKIAANDLDKAVAGSRLLLVGPDDDEDELMDDVMDDLTGLLDSVDKSGRGVCVQASTLGSLEALLDFLKAMKIPVMAISIGPVFKRDVIRACTMLEKAKELAVMLCFDVKIDKEAEQYAQEQGIRIFSADIIYHLFDSFTKYQKELLEARRKENMHDAVFPCVLKTIQVINKRNPMIIGVDVVDGALKIGTPIAIVKTDATTNEKATYDLGRVVSLEVNHKAVESIRKGQTNAGVAMRLEASGSGTQPTWGRHIDEKDNLYSHITRKSIDILKDPAFRSEVPREDWVLIKNLKPVFDIK